MPSLRRRATLAFALVPALLLAGAASAGRPIAGSLAAGGCSSLCLSEFLPRPRAVDWNGDGSADILDRWIELYNAGGEPVDPDGWSVDACGTSYTLPSGTPIPAHGYRVYFGLNLNPDGGTIVLLSPEDVPVCCSHYLASDPDRSWVLSEDGPVLRESCRPTPGEPNALYCRLYLPFVAR